jgi:hypothetical protein
MHIVRGLKNVSSLNPNGAIGVMQSTYRFAKFLRPHVLLDIKCSIQDCHEDGNVSVYIHPHQPPKLLESLCLFHFVYKG